MVACGGKFTIQTQAFDVDDAESEEQALTLAHNAIIKAIESEMGTQGKKCDGTCTDAEKKCSVSVPSKEIKAATQDVFEYEDDDGDTAYGVEIPRVTWNVKCRCLKKKKAKKKKE